MECLLNEQRKTSAIELSWKLSQATWGQLKMVHNISILLSISIIWSWPWFFWTKTFISCQDNDYSPDLSYQDQLFLQDLGPEQGLEQMNSSALETNTNKIHQDKYPVKWR